MRQPAATSLIRRIHWCRVRRMIIDKTKAPISRQALQKWYYEIDRDGRTRTLDTLDISQLLYLLSYVPLSTAGCMGRAAVFCVVTANRIPRQAVTPCWKHIHM